MNAAERITGTVVGGVVASKIGSAVGRAVNPLVGKFVGLAAGTVAGVAGSIVVSSLTHLFREDDSVIISRLFTAVLINTITENLLSKTEQDELVKLLEKDLRGLKRLKKRLHKSENQVYDIQRFLMKKIKKITKSRLLIPTNYEEQITCESESIVKEGDFCYEM